MSDLIDASLTGWVGTSVSHSAGGKWPTSPPTHINVLGSKNFNFFYNLVQKTSTIYTTKRGTNS